MGTSEDIHPEVRPYSQRKFEKLKNSSSDYSRAPQVVFTSVQPENGFIESKKKKKIILFIYIFYFIN